MVHRMSSTTFSSAAVRVVDTPGSVWGSGWMRLLGLEGGPSIGADGARGEGGARKDEVLGVVVINGEFGAVVYIALGGPPGRGGTERAWEGACKDSELGSE
jgi:hypothetical protein